MRKRGIKVNTEQITVMKTIQGFSLSALLFNACELGLFDVLNKKELTRKSLAENIHIHPDKIDLIVTPLIAKQFIEEREGRLTLTGLGALLRKNNDENSLYPYIMFAGHIAMPAWLELAKGLSNNKPPFELIHEQSFFEHVGENEGLLKVFTNMMSSYTSTHNLDSWFSQFHPDTSFSIVDIGGGNGELLIKILNYFTESQGVILDLPPVKEKAVASIKEANIDSRLHFRTQDFFQHYTIKADIFILSKVLHDWEDKEALRILKNIKSNMSANAHLWVIEELLPDKQGTNAYDKYMDALNIWTLCGGIERNYNSLDKLMRQANLEIVQSHHIKDSLYLLDISCVINEGEI